MLQEVVPQSVSLVAVRASVERGWEDLVESLCSSHPPPPQVALGGALTLPPDCRIFLILLRSLMSPCLADPCAVLTNMFSPPCRLPAPPPPRSLNIHKKDSVMFKKTPQGKVRRQSEAFASNLHTLHASAPPMEMNFTALFFKPCR